VNKILETITTVFECASLWSNNLHGRSAFEENRIEGFAFKVLDHKDVEAIAAFNAKRGQKYEEVVRKRMMDANSYLCFAFIDETSNEIAYTRWTNSDSFYSIPLRKEIVLKENEILTLDSYTPPEYRMKGLHREMNIRMLNWLMFEKEITKVYMVIKCFNPHLIKIPKSLGYRRVYTVVYYKKKGFCEVFKRLMGKVNK